MPRPLPTCKNATCPNYRSNANIIVIQERKEDVTFGCKTCGSVQVLTLDWRRGQQELQYQRYGRPEYAKTRAFFFQGRHS